MRLKGFVSSSPAEFTDGERRDDGLRGGSLLIRLDLDLHRADRPLGLLHGLVVSPPELAVLTVVQLIVLLLLLLSFFLLLVFLLFIIVRA